MLTEDDAPATELTKRELFSLLAMVAAIGRGEPLTGAAGYSVAIGVVRVADLTLIELRQREYAQVVQDNPPWDNVRAL